RVNTERAKLINEGIFHRLQTPQLVKNRYVEWVVLTCSHESGHMWEALSPHLSCLELGLERGCLKL
ncbi:MAG: hypothetical protein V3U27_10690, partial [Candidatus Tectomicrobia bacterium]